MPPGTSVSRLLRPSICSSCRQSMRRSQHASFSASARLPAEDSNSKPTVTLQQKPVTPEAPKSETSSATPNLFDDLRQIAVGVQGQARHTTARQSSANLLDSIMNASDIARRAEPGTPTMPYWMRPREEPHHLHVYAHKHNTHIVLTRPNREPILSYSTGNIGFRKGQRGEFDAAFQLAAYVMRTITDKGLLRRGYSQWAEVDAGSGKSRIEAPIKNLELVLRGWGKGREAVVKALLGTEGRGLRDIITNVCDDTKLKFGGTRSPNPRRLG